MDNKKILSDDWLMFVFDNKIYIHIVDESSFVSLEYKQAAILPITILQQTGASAKDIAELDMQLCRTRSSKRRRDAFKDFLAPLISQISGNNPNERCSVDGSVFIPKVPEVLNIRSRVAKVAKAKKQPATESANFSLENLFNDDNEL